MTFKSNLIKVHRLAGQFGLDPLRLLRSIRGLPAFWRDYIRFRRDYTGRIVLNPCLHDRYADAGSTKSEYFWQDLMVARWIHQANPARHVDVGSRIDGFVAHVASFRAIEVFDVRSVSSKIPGVTFRQANLMDAHSLPSDLGSGAYCDSLSCLHAIEHFGLGRYGDPIDPDGYRRGVANMAALLKPNGTLYLSTPIGRQHVEFNANWVFDPRTVVELAESNNLALMRLTAFNHESGIRDVTITDVALKELAENEYSLGIFIFRKAGS